MSGRHNGSGGTHHTTRQKGRRGGRKPGKSTYARSNKRRDADRYDRPLLEWNKGTYRGWIERADKVIDAD